jgi:hypothetical protein
MSAGQGPTHFVGWSKYLGMRMLFGENDFGKIEETE